MFMSLPIIIFLAANFSTPNLSGAGKVVWAAVTYVLMSMAFTAVDVPYWTLPAAMTSSISKRTTIYSVSRMSTTLASVALGVVVIPLVNSFGGGDMAKGYFTTAIVIGIAGAILYICGFSLIREHVAATTEKFSFKLAVKVISTNKPLLMAILAMIVSYSTSFLRQGMTIYFVQYNLGSLDLVPLFSLLSLPGMFIGMILAPIMVKRMGGKNVFILSSLFGGLMNLIFFFTGYGSTPLVMVLFVITSIPTGLTMVLVSSLIANTIEYAEWKTGSRNEGLISSSQTFSAKIIIAISGGLSGLVLSTINYAPTPVQPTQALSAFHMCMSLFPAICSFIGVIPMMFYDLTDKRHAEIVAELAERKKTAAQHA
jgi:GPH family glycoside/pentoside/hexuronide:cation symporter/probable glucitol transport protein GutA